MLGRRACSLVFVFDFFCSVARGATRKFTMDANCRVRETWERRGAAEQEKKKVFGEI